MIQGQKSEPCHCTCCELSTASLWKPPVSLWGVRILQITGQIALLGVFSRCGAIPTTTDVQAPKCLWLVEGSLKLSKEWEDFPWLPLSASICSVPFVTQLGWLDVVSGVPVPSRVGMSLPGPFSAAESGVKWHGALVPFFCWIGHPKTLLRCCSSSPGFLTSTASSPYLS